MTNRSIKYESYQTNDLRGVVYIKWSGKDERTDKPKNYTQGIKSKNVTKPERYKYFVSLHDL